MLLQILKRLNLNVNMTFETNSGGYYTNKNYLNNMAFYSDS